MDLTGSESISAESSCKNSNEISGSIEGGKFSCSAERLWASQYKLCSTELFTVSCWKRQDDEYYF